MKYFRRDDGFEVNDAKDRSVEWANATYGGTFIEVNESATPIVPILTEAEEASIKATKQAKKNAVLAKLNITAEEFSDLIGG